MRFGIVGAIGFIVDSASLYAFAQLFGLGWYVGRVFSYLTASSTTWYFNRKYTFNSKDDKLLREWGRFTLLNLGGGTINYASYALLITYSQAATQWPVIAVAVGSILGMGVNFWLSAKFAFRL